MALVNVDEDSWLLEFSGLERLAQQISQQITERDSRNTSQGIFFSSYQQILSMNQLNFLRI